MPLTISASATGSLEGEAPAVAVLYPAAARTATPVAVVFSPGEHETLAVVVNTTAFGTSSTVITIETYDPASDTWIVLLSGVAIAANSTITYLVGQYVTAAANLAAQTPLGPYMRVTATHGNANSHTYSIGVRAS